MKNRRFIIALIVFLLGMLGVFSLMLMEMPMSEETKVILTAMYTDLQIKFLMLVNPTLLLVISLIPGILLYQKLKLRLPIIERIVLRRKIEKPISLLKYGVVGGIIAGIVILLVAYSYTAFLPDELSSLSENAKTSVLVRFLYGGITEEVMIRFGLMTFFVWLASLIFKIKPISFWIGIVISSLLFGVGHFPIVFQSIENPTLLLLTYILIANSLGGLVFGWLYWKKGLESAMIAHIMAHVVMLVGNYLFA